MLMARQAPHKPSEKSCVCHEIVMALHYQVVYYHRQLESGKRELQTTMSARGEGDSSEDGKARRKAAMAVLAHADAADIAACLDALALPAHENLREAENGLVMVRGRIGGDGAPFNLGEATVSRAAVRLASGEVGFGYTLGRDRDKARLIALCDALVQSRDHAESVEAKVIAPLRAAISARHAQRAAETAATRVDFYTMVRGEG
jgi:alpha-D-ribose 1-methylphosphonate 5-triphosphate synthase subunit PhnG